MIKQRDSRTGSKRRFRMIIPAYPAFNIYSRIAKRTTALGPIFVATVVSKIPGWEAEIIDENNYWHIGPVDKDGLPDHETLQHLHPADVVGLYGGLSSTAPRLFELARWYNNAGAIVVGGGQHFADEANIREAMDNGIHYVVVGEGEETIAELIQAIEDDRNLESIKGIAFISDGKLVLTPTRPEITEFDKLPLPDFSLLRYARIRVYPVSWVRGCGMNCEFCTVKGRVRCPVPNYVLEQVTSLVERQNARHFFIVDDLFGQNRTATLELCRLLQQYQQNMGIKLWFTVQIRLDKSRDSELLREMRRTGIREVAIGFESPIPEELSAMNKKLKPEDMIAMARIFRKAGFYVHGMFIFGYPVQPAIDFSMSASDRLKYFRRFIREARIDTIQVLLPVPLPGTEMTARLSAENRIFPKSVVGWEFYDGNFPLFIPDPPMTAEDMQWAIRRIMGKFYGVKHMFIMVRHAITLPFLVFAFSDIQSVWHKWYRLWRNTLIRLGGWTIVRSWTRAFRKGDFPERLEKAKQLLQSTMRSNKVGNTINRAHTM